MKTKKSYVCANCNTTTMSWAGMCSTCNEWGTIEEFIETKGKSQSKSNSNSNVKAMNLNDIEVSMDQRILSDMEEVNRVLGGGLVKDSVSIITASPGMGKSTLLLELTADFAKKGISVLYASGEESETQIKSRALRIMKNIPKNIWIMSTTYLDDVLSNIRTLKPGFVVIDSIQTFQLQEFAQRAGGPVQTMECANALVEIAKNKTSPTAVMMVGHVNKTGEMAGLKTLEHLVDTVLYLDEGETGDSLRILMSSKNRFGRTGEIGLFQMDEDGMKEITNPADFFITKRKDGEKVPGASLSIIKEGSRYLVIELEALVSQSYTPYPQRLGDSLRRDQLNTLISILEERCKIRMYDKNVILKATGGIKLSEQSVNLAVIMSIVSSMKNIGISQDTIFIAEVGLTGELKKVPNIEYRIKEADRLGYKKVYIPEISIEKEKFKNIKVIEKRNVNDVINDLFK